ncbi:ribonuclease H [Senna tora]|uniref:Ribonuclease H n=1 Tax=Senna tora TaxID=362788 RepID=A0A835CKF3_9FABA|nr:ribonuclease H [Senna tora]
MEDGRDCDCEVWNLIRRHRFDAKFLNKQKTNTFKTASFGRNAQELQTPNSRGSYSRNETGLKKLQCRVYFNYFIHDIPSSRKMPAMRNLTVSEVSNEGRPHRLEIGVIGHQNQKQHNQRRHAPRRAAGLTQKLLPQLRRWDHEASISGHRVSQQEQNKWQKQHQHLQVHRPCLHGCLVACVRWYPQQKHDNPNYGNKLRRWYVRSQLEFYLDCEESLWAQKARETWLVNGDRYTAYFHNIVKRRRVQNHITTIQDENGGWCDNLKDIQSMGISYFKDIFTETSTWQVDQILSNLGKYHIPSLTDTHLNVLNLPLSEDECFLALNQMKLDGAPGPDGFHVRFYRQFWDIVKGDVLSMLNSFFQNGIMDPKLNMSYITLIPKTLSPQTFKDFRRISLANVSYKLVTKILCNRLKVILPDIIAPNQSAFLKGRLIGDNILLATEVMNKIKNTRNGKTGWCALKLDTHKAYDKLSWNFIEAVLRRMVFLDIWIKYIMNCLTSVEYQLLINGGVTDKFQPTCGIRQGDPISPYIFILYANVLSCMIRKQEDAKLWQGVKIGRTSIPITHLMYVDDALLFFQATEFNIHSVKRVLKEYGDMAGQEMNSGTYIDYRESKTLGVQETIDKIENKLKDWKALLLSQAATLTLIKSVINSYLVYPLSCIQFPKNKCRKIESLMSNFFWGYTGNCPKIHLHNWQFLCKPKLAGGLALCDVQAFNHALLAKHLWRVLTSHRSPAVSILASKYVDSKGSLIIPSKLLGIGRQSLNQKRSSIPM